MSVSVPLTAFVGGLIQSEPVLLVILAKPVYAPGQPEPPPVLAVNGIVSSSAWTMLVARLASKISATM